MGNEIFHLEGDPLRGGSLGDFVAPYSNVEIHPPCSPGKIVCVAVNHPGIEGYREDMMEPLVFLKAPSSVVSDGAVVSNPFMNHRWWGEAEFGVVVSKRIKNVSVDEVAESVLGFTIGNDVTVENCDGRDHHLARSKSSDGFCPLGPWIETDLPHGEIVVRAWQDGELIREGQISDQVWSWKEAISHISKWLTLEPFDVVLTGNMPDTCGMQYLKHGSVYEAEVTGIGTLRNVFVESLVAQGLEGKAS